MAAHPNADPNAQAGSSRIANFFKMSVAERIDALSQRGLLDADDIALLASSQHRLSLPVADKMIENVVGVFGLPLGLALNFLINDRDYVVPLVVEEPSIVAGLSGAARMARLSGGYQASATQPILIGQIQTMLDREPEPAMQALLAHRDEIIATANELMPNMVKRGGGMVDIEVHRHLAEQDGRHMVVLHLLIDTQDAMGANLVNTVCEGVAPLVEKLTGGEVFLRILSNLTDRARALAKVTIAPAHLAGKGFTGEQVRDGIILANDLALADPYRAATHNKGIMNGVDAVAIATGNDWRAIEAAAHAYAAKDGRYRGLTRWYKDKDGNLVGEIDIPMKVGTVGGSLETNPSVRINHRLLGSPNATELAAVMGTIGLAQNFAALRALSTNGIQQNHMNLHARSVASTAKVPEAYFDQVVDVMIASGEIKVWKAEEILSQLTGPAEEDNIERHAACGKIILLGEHSVVYGRPAIALPIPLAVEASIIKGGSDVRVQVPDWQINQPIAQDAEGLGGMLASLLNTLGLADESLTIRVWPHVPRAMGLGGSAALAVAILRALNHSYELGLTDERINALAFESEKAAHGTPSGVDNTVATYGQALIYRRRDDRPTFESVHINGPLFLVVGTSSEPGLTAQTVAAVRSAWKKHPDRYNGLFDQIGDLTEQARTALATGDIDNLGELMNLCHGYLNGLQLSTPQLETLVHTARSAGALGAKLTGGGGGGSMIALCRDAKQQEEVAGAIRRAGFGALTVSV